MVTRILGPAVVVLLVAAAGALAVPLPCAAAAAAPAPARAAAACPGASGVTAVVDFNELGGGVTAGCAPDGGGRSASRVFADAGYSLEAHPQMPSFVCRVNGRPADGPCAENDAFWSLWWSDGKDGRWHWSSQGVGSLSVPDGGYVAFAWHQGSGDASPPDARPTPHPTSTPEPSHGGDGGGTGGGDGGGTGGGGGSREDTDEPTPASPTPTATDGTTGPRETPSERKTAGDDGPDRRRDGNPDRGSAEPSPTESSTVPEVSELTEGPPADAEPADDDALPLWVPIGLAVLAVGAAAAVPILRRRSG